MSGRAFNFGKIIKILHVSYCCNTGLDDRKNNQIYISDDILLSQSLQYLSLTETFIYLQNILYYNRKPSMSFKSDKLPVTY